MIIHAQSCDSSSQNKCIVTNAKGYVLITPVLELAHISLQCPAGSQQHATTQIITGSEVTHNAMIWCGVMRMRDDIFLPTTVYHAVPWLYWEDENVIPMNTVNSVGPHPQVSYCIVWAADYQY